MGVVRFGALVAVLLVVAAACGTGFDREAEAELLAESFGFSQEEALCVVDSVIDDIGEDRLIELNNDDPTPQEVDQLFDAINQCGGNSSDLLGETAVTDLAQSFGISQDEARCVVDLAVERIGADRLAEVGSITDADVDDAEAQELLAIVAECT